VLAEEELAEFCAEDKNHDEVDDLELAEGLEAGDAVGGGVGVGEEDGDGDGGEAGDKGGAGEGELGVSWLGEMLRSGVARGAPCGDCEQGEGCDEADDFVPAPLGGVPVGAGGGDAEVGCGLGWGEAVGERGEGEGEGDEGGCGPDADGWLRGALGDEDQGGCSGVCGHEGVHGGGEREAGEAEDEGAAAGDLGRCGWGEVERGGEGEHHAGRGEAARGEVGVHH
jgi:hypothetical protein